MSADIRSNPSTRPSWRNRRDPRQMAPLSRNAKRWLTTLGVAVFAAILVYILYLWLIRPAHHAYFAVAPLIKYEPPEIPPNAFAKEDADALQGLVPAAYSNRRELDTHDKFRELSTFIGDLPLTKHDSLVVYLSGHGVSSNGVPLFLPSDAWELQDKLIGKCDLASLLAGFQAHAKANKLLILDSGRLDTDLRLGLVVNEFPQLVEQHMKQRDDGLWLLLPADAFQTTVVDYSSQRSVFGRFVAEALAGLANANGDRYISLDELCKYVSKGLAPYGQTALLMHAGQGRVPLDKAPQINLLSFKRQKPKETTEKKESPATGDDDESKPTSLLPASRQIQKTWPGGGLAWQQPAIPAPLKSAESAVRSAESAVRSAESEVRSAESTIKSAESAAKPADPAAKPPVASANPPASSAKPTETAEPKLDASTPVTRKSLAQALTVAWKQRDLLRRDANTSAWLPCDYAPHRWRELDIVLLDLERRSRSGSFYETQTVMNQLLGLAKELKTLVQSHQADALGQESSARHSSDDDTLDVVRKLDVARREFKSDADRDGRPTISADAAAVIQARQVHNAASYDAPDFLQWQFSEVLVAGERGNLSDDSLKALLQTLASLQAKLDRLAQLPFDAQARSDLEAETLAVSEAHAALRASLSKRATELLQLDTQDIAGHATRQRQIEAVLATPLLNAETRRNLCLVLLKPPPALKDGSARPGDAPSPSPPWGEIRRLLNIEIELLALSKPVLPELTLIALRKSHDNLADARPDACWQEYRKFGSLLRESRIELVKNMKEAFLKSNDDATARDTLSRGLWLVDGRDARPLDARIHSYARLNVKKERTLAFGPDPSPFNLAEHWQKLNVPVDAIALSPSQDEVTLRLRFDDKRIAVRMGDSGDELAKESTQPVPVEELLGKSGSAGGSGGAIRLQVRAKEADAGGAAPPVNLTLELTAKRPQYPTLNAIPLDIKCRLPSPERIVVRLQREGSSKALREKNKLEPLRLEPFPNRETAFRLWLENPSGRDREISLELWAVPFIREATWAPGRLFVSGNQVPVEVRKLLFKDVASRLLPLRADIDPKLLLFRKDSLVLKTGETSLDKDLFAKPEPPPGAAAPPTPATPATPPAAAPAAPLGPDISHGLVVLITDLQTKQRWDDWIEIVPLRPDKFLDSRVQYNSEIGRLQAQVSIKKDLDADEVDDTVPGLDKQPVTALLQLDEAKFSKGAENRKVELTRPGESKLLFAAAPQDNLKRHLALQIDGYPRAFRYDVLCDAGGLDQIPVNTDALRITKLSANYQGQDPPDGKAGEDARLKEFVFTGEGAAPFPLFPSPLSDLIVGFEVDAPENAFVSTSGRNLVELRLLPKDNERMRRSFYSDRQASTRLVSLRADGYLTLKASVSDYSVAWPINYNNLSIEVDAAMFRDGVSQTESAPVSVILDGKSPHVGNGASLKPVAGPKAVVLQGEIPVEDGLTGTGVQKLEVWIDKNPNGKFDEKEEPLYLASSQDRAMWSLKWDLSKAELTPGHRYDLYARATDRVGWRSGETLVGSFLYPEMSDATPKTFGVVKGTVKLGGTPLRAGSAKVSLRVAEPEQIIQAEIGADGAYILPGVPAGRHMIRVKGEFLTVRINYENPVTMPAVDGTEVKFDIVIPQK